MIRAFLWLLFFPIQIALLLLFLLVETLGIPFSLFRRKTDTGSIDTETPCSIIILNWNGRHLLEECIPAVLRAVRAAGAEHQVMVVDNGSEDDSVSWLKSRYPEVDLLELDQNLGFGEGNNRGVEAARFDRVVLLNNDMIPEKDFLPPLLEPFKDPKVFAVSAQVYFPPGKRREETGNTTVRFRYGYPHFSHEPVRDYHYRRKSLPVLWAGGGSSAFRKDLFLRLGGFNRIFSPCYFEDTDLSYRAWRRGWRVLFAPESRILHRHRSSSSARFNEQQLESLIEQRKLWYLWRNFQLGTLGPHFFLFPIHLAEKLSVSAYLKALRKIPVILLSRLKEPVRFCSDARLLSWIDRPVTYLNRFYPDRAKQTRSPGSPLRILVVSAYLPHLGTHGGAGRVFQLMSRTCRSHPVDLITFVEDRKDLSYADQARRCCRNVITVFRNRYDPLSVFPYEPFEEFNCPDFRRELERLLAGEDYDVVHFEWTQMALFADLFPRTPRIITEIEVNYAAHQTLIGVERNPLRKIRLYYNTLQTLYREIELCRKVDRVICVTTDDRDYLAGYLPEEKLAVVNTGVDTRYFHFEPDAGEAHSLVFVGAFRHAPNIDAMHYFSEQIFPRVLDEFPDVHLYVVGSSPTPEIRRLASHPNISVTGYVEDIREYYRRAQVVVVPLRTGVGIRGKILEAWSAGRAVVATPLACQGLKAIHGHNIVIAETPEEFAMWTAALLRNPDHCARLGRRGRKLVEEAYGWDILGEQMAELYREVGEGGTQ